MLLTLGVVEALFRLSGQQPMGLTEDPYVGFQPTHPLFVPVTAEPGTQWLQTAPRKLGFFNQQRFRANKPPGTIRIFCLGGSTTYGRPYDHTTSFCGWIGALLERLYPDRRFETINAGGISYASYRLTRMMEELNRYQPDLYLVYTGHNEFLEARTYGELRDTPAWVATADTLLGRLASYSTLRRLFKQPPVEDDRTRMQPEVDEILAHSVGPEDYQRNDRQRARTLEHFRFNLERMAELAAVAGARITYVVPASNYRDFEPFKSEHSATLDPRGREQWRRQFDAGRNPEASTDPSAIAASLSVAAQLDPRHADGQFALGRALLAVGRQREAYSAFQRAIDEDIAPLRAPSDFVRAVRDLAPLHQLVDFPALIEKTSPVPGNDWFLDHVHPTIEGHRRLALAILNSWIDAGQLPEPPDGWPDLAEEVRRQVLATIDTEKQAHALRNLAQVLGWAGKLEAAHRLLLQAQSLVGDQPEILDMLGQSLLRLQRPREAAALFERLINASPAVDSFLLAASAYLQAGQPRRAIAMLASGIARFPDSHRLHLRMAELLVQDGSEAAAQRHRQSAETLVRRQLVDSPDDQSLRFALARLLEARHAWSEARDHYLLLVEHTPDHAGYNARLGQVSKQLGRTAESERWLRSAIAIDPSRESAYDQLATLYLEQGQTGQALQTYEQLLARHPEHTPALVNRAILLHQLDRSSEAIEALRSAVLASPEDPDAHYALAVIATDSGNVKDAIAAYQRVLELDATHANAHNNLGGVLARSGLLVQALHHFEQALLHDPNNPGVRRNIEMLRQQQRQHLEEGRD